MGPVIPIIELIIGAAGLGFSGASAAGAFTPSAPKPPTGPQPLTGGQRNQLTSLVSGELPNIQDRVGGALSPEAYLLLAQLATGTAGTPGGTGTAQQSVNQFFGLNPSGTGPIEGTGTGLTSGSVF